MNTIHSILQVLNKEKIYILYSGKYGI